MKTIRQIQRVRRVSAARTSLSKPAQATFEDSLSCLIPRRASLLFVPVMAYRPQPGCGGQPTRIARQRNSPVRPALECRMTPREDKRLPGKSSGKTLSIQSCGQRQCWPVTLGISAINGTPNEHVRRVARPCDWVFKFYFFSLSTLAEMSRTFLGGILAFSLSSFLPFEFMSYRTEYLMSEHWREVKRRFKLSGLYHRRCECCLSQSVPLDIHHKTYKRLGNERLNDLIALCPICHAAAHLIHDSNRRDGLWTVVRGMTRKWKKFATKRGFYELHRNDPMRYARRLAAFFSVNLADPFVARVFSR